MKLSKIIGLSLLVLLIIAQFISPKPPANRTDNPGDLIKNGLASGEVAQLLKNSCYDCHSSEVNYPWYSHISPVSLLVRRDVILGTEELNFSDWEDLKKRRKLKMLKEIQEVIEEDKMSLGIYTLIHRDAKLSDQDKKLLIDWVKVVTAEILE